MTITSNISAVNVTSATGHPNMFLNQTDINTIKNRISNSQEPQKSAYTSFLTKVNTAYDIPLQSVTYKGNTRPGGDSHDYYTENAYCWETKAFDNCVYRAGCAPGKNWYCDGHRNPNAHREDYIAAMNMSYSVRDLGLAYQITGDNRYADKAVQLIKTWCINSATYMRPRFYSDDQSKIEPVITIPAMFYGADLIWNYSGFSASDKTSLKSWVQQFINSAATWEGYNNNNNYELWRLVFVATGAIIAGDNTSLQHAFDRLKYVIPLSMDEQGRAIKEMNRTQGLYYSLSAIKPMLDIAEIAKHHGVDLYNYKSGTKSIELMLDYHDYYCSDPILPSRWIAAGYQEINPQYLNFALWEFAYRFKQKVEWKEVLTVRGRPQYSTRIIGPVTLTHGVQT